jgi:flagellar hook-length control protein FliK
MAMADTTPDAPVQSAPAAPALPVPSLAAQTPVARAAPSAIRQPASEVFAAAMFAADRPAPRASVHRSEMGELLALSTPATAPLTVQATGTAGQPALDTRQHDWPAAMIERIEVLRDAVETNVRETRIRLVPDALGPIDVSIRQDGDTTNVRLTAETPQARAMLAEAAPRLTELADARGLKLAQAGVETGAGGFAGRHAQQQPDQPARPASARTAEAVEDDADHRIA